jgi:hypothetical protein
MTRKMVSNSNNIKKKRKITSHLKSTYTNNITTHDAGNPGHGLRQAQQCVGSKPVN